ncbi:hypothetical protein CROQUDRAFT_102564 [Cronartium quercuum f. sp. fusiforme G11]|uniref:Uncharacterized protein n=1 Tax=Cronartium quercuum f. sp. fusiforme G11 TaxID=708437 RepID=A0A9P6N4Q2_9BASI|nr:hypothetical protein CROQUDRAFT_102564 [Cronartium quercuum f. sp. fusiforme G11]
MSLGHFTFTHFGPIGLQLKQGPKTGLKINLSHLKINLTHPKTNPKINLTHLKIGLAHPKTNPKIDFTHPKTGLTYPKTNLETDLTHPKIEPIQHKKPIESLTVEAFL